MISSVFPLLDIFCMQTSWATHVINIMALNNCDQNSCDVGLHNPEHFLYLLHPIMTTKILKLLKIFLCMTLDTLPSKLCRQFVCPWSAPVSDLWSSETCRQYSDTKWSHVTPYTLPYTEHFTIKLQIFTICIIIVPLLLAVDNMYAFAFTCGVLTTDTIACKMCKSIA